MSASNSKLKKTSGMSSEIRIKQFIQDTILDPRNVDQNLFQKFLKTGDSSIPANFWSYQDNNFILKILIWIREVIISKNPSRYFPYVEDAVYLRILNLLNNKKCSEIFYFIKRMSYLIGFNKYSPSIVEFINAHRDTDETRKNIQESFCYFFGKNVSTVQNKPIYEIEIWYEVNMICAGTIANILLKLIKNPNVIIKWEIPDSWYYPVQSQHPFENYLQDKNTTIIDTLLTEGNALIKKEEIGWWTNIKDLHKQNINYYIKHFMEYTPNMFWLPRHRRLQKYNLQAFNSGKKFEFRDENSDLLMMMYWNTLSETFPPMMSPKFHIMNTKLLDPYDNHSILVMPWFVSWAMNFGIEFFDICNYKIQLLDNIRYFISDGEYIPELTSDPVHNWLEARKKLMEVIREIRLTSPNSTHTKPPHDNISRSSQFLLEPFILIQIPWNFVIFRQWMSAAMIEILKFEADTVEFRHWPIIDPRVEKCARELLFLVKQNKHRLLVALYYMSRQIALYPSTCSSLPENLMDIAIIPSIPFLQFLTSGTAYKLLNTLKQTAFTSSEEFNNNKIMFLDETIYQVHPNLDKIFVNHYFNFTLWSRISEHLESLTPYQYFGNDFFDDLNKNIPPIANKYKMVSDLSVEEKCLFGTIFESNHENNILVNELMSAMAETINCIIQYQYFPKSTEKIIKNIFTSKSYLAAANELVKQKDLLNDSFEIKSDIGKILVSAYIHNLIRNKLNNALKNNVSAGFNPDLSTPDGWLYRLTGEVIERNCLARIVKLVSLTIRKTPTFPNLSTCPKENLESFSPIINDIFIRQNEIKRDWLWNQFPKEWNQKVRFDHTVPDILDENKSVLLVIKEAVKIFEERLGCLLLNIAKDNFVAYDDLRKKFPYWENLQYIMPVFLSMLLGLMKVPVGFKKLRNRVHNYIKLIDTMLIEYEQNYKDWLTSDKYYREDVSPKILYDERVQFTKLDMLKIINDCSQSSVLAHDLMRNYIGISNKIAPVIDGIPNFLSFIRSFECFYYLLKEIDWNNIGPEVFIIMKSIRTFDKNFFEFLHKSCIKAWNPPQPGIDLMKMNDLNKLYLADRVLFRLSYELSQIFGIDNLENLMPSTKLQNCLVCDCNDPNLVRWRALILSAICSSENHYKDVLPTNEYLIERDKHGIIHKGNEHINKIWKQFRVLVRKIDKFPNRIEPLYFDSPAIIKAFEIFCSGHIDELQDYLQLKDPGHVKTKIRFECNTLSYHRGNYHVGVLTNQPRLASAQLPKLNKKAKLHQEGPKPKLNRCHLCHVKEKRSGSFIVCPSCIEENYPDTHFYCSIKCKDKEWAKEHNIEHTEFQLGISDFCSF